MSEQKKPLIVLTGPTAVGKTSLSIKLAKSINAEIISGDSMQVYKGMDIGTAKITKDEMQGVVHHLIDIIEPNVPYDVFTFKEMAKPIVSDIHNRDMIPLVAGGTGFYIQALAYDIEFTEDTDTAYRESLFKEAKEQGIDFIVAKLKEVDPEYALSTPKENIKRIVRALEFYKTTGTKLSAHNENERKRTSPYDLKYFCLTKNRDDLYADIDKRVDIMVREGLIKEAKWLYDLGLKDVTAIKAIGYRELFPYFDGECSQDEAINKIKLDTRHFAKRQLTWFRREKDVIEINKDIFKSEDEILSYILGIINGECDEY